MPKNPLWEILLLSPFFSVEVEYCVEQSCLLPDIKRGYFPESAFVGTIEQVYSWLENNFPIYISDCSDDDDDDDDDDDYFLVHNDHYCDKSIQIDSEHLACSQCGEITHIFFDWTA